MTAPRTQPEVSPCPCTVLSCYPEPWNWSLPSHRAVAAIPAHLHPEMSPTLTLPSLFRLWDPTAGSRPQFYLCLRTNSTSNSFFFSLFSPLEKHPHFLSSRKCVHKVPGSVHKFL